MKHASQETIQLIEPLLKDIRLMPGLVEKKPGVYYYKSRAFLHFHEEDSDTFADVRLVEPEFQRLPCTTENQQKQLVVKIRNCLISRSG